MFTDNYKLYTVILMLLVLNLIYNYRGTSYEMEFEVDSAKRASMHVAFSNKLFCYLNNSGIHVHMYIINLLY